MLDVETKTLPSPILPVLAALTMARDGRIQPGIADHDFEFDFRQEIHGVFAAAIDFRVALLPAESLDFATVMPSMPISPRASFTSSSLNGFMMASIFFIVSSVEHNAARQVRKFAG